MIMHLMRSLILAQIFYSHTKSHYRANGILQKCQSKTIKRAREKEKRSTIETETYNRESPFDENRYIPAESNADCSAARHGHAADILI